MPEPEIARRCLSCGVSIRVRATFCPQCGKPLTRKSDSASDANDTAPLTPDTLPLANTAHSSESAPTEPLNSRTAKSIMPFSTPPSVSRKKPMQATAGMVHRAESRPREAVGEDGPNRVEKFRQMSTAMIDEASYDPSLRFVLVAAVLFVLFLLLLLLSELIT